MRRKMIERGTPNFAQALLAVAISAPACLLAPLTAQTHKVAKPETVVRAVGVYEWTGDMAKPAASRLIPVSLFIDGKLEDAAVYLARPVPFALLTGNLYELDQAGLAKGTLDLLYSRHFEAAETAATTYDDGWFGYGKFVPPTPPRRSTLKPSKTLSVINSLDDDPSKPHFSAKSATPGSGASANPAPGTSASSDTPPADPDRPTMKRHPDTSDQTAGSSSTSTPPDTPPADPDRPTMTRHTDTSDQTAGSGSSSSGSSTSGSGSSGDTPSADPDRPTLRRRTPEEAKKARGDQPSVSDTGSLNDDPNRPMLHRGKPAGVPAEADFPKLTGLPGDQDLHQMVAVSDAADRPVHDFSRAWDDEAEHQAILAKLQAAARAQLSAYETANAVKPAAPAPDPRRPNSKLRRSPTPDTPPPPPEPLLDEQLKAYTLSYGGAPTYVYSAHNDGLGPTLRYVTLVAQVNMQGEPEVALKTVTDAAHLDRTPRYRLVDVVDAEASNRASLLFELRAQNSRQFALYRVIGARADQTFLTGTTQ
jgi:hypothetical protein